jgi:hypothetical protein
MAATSETKCAYPGCASVTSGYKYCRPHSAWIRAQALCYDCLQPKESPEHRLCSGCYLIEKMRKREQAVEAGLCTNYWKCKAPATKKGAMCANCFHEYMKARGEWVVVKPAQPAPVQAPAQEVAPPKAESFPQTLGRTKSPAAVTCWASPSEKVKAKPEPPKAPTPAPAPKTPVASPKPKPATPATPKKATPPLSPKKSPASTPIKSKPAVELDEAVDVATVCVVKSLF